MMAPNRVGMASAIALAFAAALSQATSSPEVQPRSQPRTTVSIRLPEPWLEGGMSVEEALNTGLPERLSADRPLTLAEVGQILWAGKQAMSMRGPTNRAPFVVSYVPRIYLVAADVNGLPPGVYLYEPRNHGVCRVSRGNSREELAQATGDTRLLPATQATTDEGMVRSAPASIVIAGRCGMVAADHGHGSDMCVPSRAGRVVQNVQLQVAALGLGTVPILAYQHKRVSEVLWMAPREQPLCIMPIGAPR